jgi:hypothetical protein
MGFLPHHRIYGLGTVRENLTCGLPVLNPNIQFGHSVMWQKIMIKNGQKVSLKQKEKKRDNLITINP